MPPLIELPFNITIDLSVWSMILTLPTLQLIRVIFAIAGWAALALVIFWVGAHLWHELREEINVHHWQWVVLAVDVPPDTIQSPKAVEQIFAHLSGALEQPGFVDKYWGGAKQKGFSLEVISLEGYIQFLIYTEVAHRDLVEAAIYAQYPMAEITEVEDYTSMIPDKYPNDTHNMTGIEFGLAAPEAFPIRNYDEFEHNFAKDVTFADPMASILENFTRIGPGENLWLQIVIEPAPDSWKEHGIEVVKGLITGGGHHGGEQFFLFKWINFVLDGIIHAIIPPHEGEHGAHEEHKEGKISDLSPGARDNVKAVEEKISKVGFKSKMRVLYAAPKAVFNPGRCISGLIGSINQFNYTGRNALVPAGSASNGKTSKKNKAATSFVKAFKKRKLKMGKPPYVLNVEELATIWHFPIPLVKPPLLQKTSTKRAEPPINLPVEMVAESPLKRKSFAPPTPPKEEPPEPPELMWG